jgi:hypothetical protein
VVGADPASLIDAWLTVALSPPVPSPPLWDGRAAQRIVDVLAAAAVRPARQEARVMDL